MKIIYPLACSRPTHFCLHSLFYLQPTHDPVCCICASDKLLILVSVVKDDFNKPTFPCYDIHMAYIFISCPLGAFTCNTIKHLCKEKDT